MTMREWQEHEAREAMKEIARDLGAEFVDRVAKELNARANLTRVVFRCRGSEFVREQMEPRPDGLDCPAAPLLES